MVLGRVLVLAINLLEMCKFLPQIVTKYDFEMLTDESNGTMYNRKTYLERKV